MISRNTKSGRLRPGAKGARTIFITRPGAPDEVRAEIIKAAAIAFMERGYAATAIDDVADALGATKGRIYHYYRSKTDIFIDIHLESLRVLLERIRPIAAQKNLKSHERLFAICREHVVTMITTVAYYKSTVIGLNRFLLSITAPYQDEAMRRVLQQRAEYEDLLAEVIAEGTAEGIFVEIDPHFATKPMLGTLNWLNIWYESSSVNGTSDAEEVANALAAFCVNAVMKRQPIA
jgi:AcrR family transcriptional regulator